MLWGALYINVAMSLCFIQQRCIGSLGHGHLTVDSPYAGQPHGSPMALRTSRSHHSQSHTSSSINAVRLRGGPPLQDPSIQTVGVKVRVSLTVSLLTCTPLIPGTNNSPSMAPSIRAKVRDRIGAGRKTNVTLRVRLFHLNGTRDQDQGWIPGFLRVGLGLGSELK